MANFTINIGLPEEASARVVAFTERILAPATDVADLFSDKVRYFRWRSAMRTLQRAEEIARETNVTPKLVPLKFLVPFLEDASLEEEDSPLTEAWARLLVAASTEFDSVYQAYADVLKKLGPTEVELLDRLYREGGLGTKHEKVAFDHETMRRILEIRLRSLFSELSEHENGLSFDLIGNLNVLLGVHYAIAARVNTYFAEREIIAPNMDVDRQKKHLFILQNNNLVSFDRIEVGNPLPAYPRRIVLEWVQLTEFGYDFIETCRTPGVRAASKAASVAEHARQKPEYVFDVTEDSSEEDILASLLANDR